MRRLLPFVAILIVGCSGSSGSTPPGDSSIAPTAASATNQPSESVATTAPNGASGAASSDGPAASAPAGAAGLPAACAPGLAALLTAIEPAASKFDAGKASMGDLAAMEDTAQSKSIELLKSKTAPIPYECTTAGLAWVSLGEATPWDAVLAAAAGTAPGTVAFLTAVRDHRSNRVAKVADFGVTGCDAAVAAIKKGVKARASGGSKDIKDMALSDGLKLLGLYVAYMHDVQNGACPPDKLGNDEFEFFGSMS